MGAKSIRIPVSVKAAHYTTKKVPTPILIITNFNLFAR